MVKVRVAYKHEIGLVHLIGGKTREGHPWRSIAVKICVEEEDPTLNRHSECCASEPLDSDHHTSMSGWRLVVPGPTNGDMLSPQAGRLPDDANAPRCL